MALPGRKVDFSFFFFYMLLEEFFLSFRLMKKQISGPVACSQSSEGFLQVVVFLEVLDDFLQLLLSPLNWSKPKAKNILLR